MRNRHTIRWKISNKQLASKNTTVTYEQLLLSLPPEAEHNDEDDNNEDRTKHSTEHDKEQIRVLLRVRGAVQRNLWLYLRP